MFSFLRGFILLGKLTFLYLGIFLIIMIGAYYVFF